MTLIMAVVVYESVFAQAGPQSPAAASPAANARVKVVAFPSAIDSVLRDFPYNLRHITGEEVLAQGEFENYASLVVVPEAQSCVVTRYHSADDTTASWQAKMFSSERISKAP